MEHKPEKNIALITGGSSGIGLAIAHVLASKGYNLLLVSNQQDALENCKQEIEDKHKVICHIYYLDLATDSAAEELYNYTSQQNWLVSILVNNAGILVFSEVITTPINKQKTILQLHINTPTFLCRLYGKDMAERKAGHILNVSSISSVMPYPGISLYGPTKTFMRYFTRAFRTEMKVNNVHVTCLIPGATATALYDIDKVNVPLALKLGVMHKPPFVARKAVKALFKNKAECVPGILNKLTVNIIPLIPHWLISLIHRKTDIIKQGEDVLG